MENTARTGILVENFAPGVTDRLGIGPATLQQINPRLIYGSSSGYGKSGPYKDYPVIDGRGWAPDQDHIGLRTGKHQASYPAQRLFG